jgi:peptide deformylase
MSILKVARLGHPVLRTRSRELTRAEVQTPIIQEFIDDLIDTMREYDGAGLAAPQVHHGVRIFVAAIDPNDDEPVSVDAEPMVFINPVVKPIGADTEEDWEGCLSVPDMRGRVVRAGEVEVTFMDRRGERLVATAHGHQARVIQHENDHLDGVVFLDRMTKLDSLTYLEEYARYWSKNRKQ